MPADVTRLTKPQLSSGQAPPAVGLTIKTLQQEIVPPIHCASYTSTCCRCSLEQPSRLQLRSIDQRQLAPGHWLPADYSLERSGFQDFVSTQ